MAKTLKYFKYSANDSGEVLVSCSIDDNGNEMQAATTIKPDKDGAAHLKQFNDWVVSYLKTKYGCDK